MCGIAGFETLGQPVEERAGALLNCLQNRGPDGGWHLERMGFCLVQTRLAIIDLSDRVTYPMANETGDLWLLFNGEIYDQQLLRSELKQRGHGFRTKCDAEVILHAYEEWGIAAFDRVNGMFALALVDEKAGEVVLARDRFGIKPLVRRNHPFAFSSDALALVSSGLSVGAIDYGAVAEFAAFHYIPAPRTGLKDIVEVAPGTAVVRRRDGEERIIQWAPSLFEAPEPTTPVAIEELDDVLARAVERHLVADVPVGVFLSGGIDSSLVLQYAAALGGQPQAFTIGFPGHGDYDELRRAKAHAQWLGLPHIYEEFASGFHEAVSSVTQAFDQPFGDSSAVATLVLSRLARGHVTVALSGTGGDDLFAGYQRHRAHRVGAVVELLPNALVTWLARGKDRSGSERANAARLAGFYVSRLARAAGADETEQYLSLVGSATSPLGVAAFAFDSDIAHARRQVAARWKLGQREAGSHLRELQQFELETYLPGDLLRKEDRATMHVGLEGRVPLLDRQVAEIARKVPDRQKASLLRGKVPLRKLVRRQRRFELPTRKRGFAVPLRDLFDATWGPAAQDWLRSSPSELVEPRLAGGLVGNPAAPASDIWALSVLVGWERRLRTARIEGQLLGAPDLGVRAGRG